METTTTERAALTLNAIDCKEFCGAQLKIKNATQISYRAFRAALYRLAADIEEATPANERWVTHIEGISEYGSNSNMTRAATISVECADWSLEEAARALALLERIARG